MKKIAAFALFGAAFAATPAHAVDPPAVIQECDVAFTLPNAEKCAGYYAGNLPVGSQIDERIAALKSLGFDWDGGNWDDLPKLEGKPEDLPNGDRLDFGQMMYGITYISAHFGKGSDEIEVDYKGGGFTVFWQFDFGSEGVSYITLAEPKGWSNAVLYSTGTSAVPEPATWMMLLLGFAAVGASLRSRTAVRLGTKGLAKA